MKIAIGNMLPSVAKRPIGPTPKGFIEQLAQCGIGNNAETTSIRPVTDDDADDVAAFIANNLKQIAECNVSCDDFVSAKREALVLTYIDPETGQHKPITHVAVNSSRLLACWIDAMTLRIVKIRKGVKSYIHGQMSTSARAIIGDCKLNCTLLSETGATEPTARIKCSGSQQASAIYLIDHHYDLDSIPTRPQLVADGVKSGADGIQQTMCAIRDAYRAVVKHHDAAANGLLDLIRKGLIKESLLRLPAWRAKAKEIASANVASDFVDALEAASANGAGPTSIKDMLKCLSASTADQPVIELLGGMLTAMQAGTGKVWVADLQSRYCTMVADQAQLTAARVKARENAELANIAAKQRQIEHDRQAAQNAIDAQLAKAARIEAARAETTLPNGVAQATLDAIESAIIADSTDSFASARSDAMAMSS